MAANRDLVEFVDRALGKGLSRDEIRMALTDAGWEPDEVRGALFAFHKSDFPVPVPSKRYSLVARDTVFYLFLFVALYLAAFGLIFLAFDILNLKIPDAADYREPATLQANVRYWLSWCIVFVPVYLFTAWKSESRRRLDPNCPMSTGRQWLTYLTLFVASMTALGDMVALVLGFLSGDLTLRTILKIAVVAIIAGAVIAYYYRDIKSAETGQETLNET